MESFLLYLQQDSCCYVSRTVPYYSITFQDSVSGVGIQKPLDGVRNAPRPLPPPPLFQWNPRPLVQRAGFVGNRDHEFQRVASQQRTSRVPDSLLILGTGSAGRAASHRGPLPDSPIHCHCCG